MVSSEKKWKVQPIFYLAHPTLSLTLTTNNLKSGVWIISVVKYFWIYGLNDNPLGAAFAAYLSTFERLCVHLFSFAKRNYLAIGFYLFTIWCHSRKNKTFSLAFTGSGPCVDCLCKSQFVMVIVAQTVHVSWFVEHHFSRGFCTHGFMLIRKSRGFTVNSLCSKF